MRKIFYSVTKRFGNGLGGFAPNPIFLFSIIISPLLFFPCGLWSQAPLNSGFCDLHNSNLYGVFRSGNLNDLEEALAEWQAVDAKMVYLSIGFPRFNGNSPDSTQIEDVLAFFKRVRAYCAARHSNNFCFIDEPQSPHKTTFAFALEGADLLANKTNYIDSLYDVGLRMLSPAHWFHHAFIIPADSSHAHFFFPIDDNSRLSAAGRQLIEKLINKGIYIDVSHLRRRVFEEVEHINNRRSPLVASHCNAYRICPHPRNLRDKQLRAIAASGGMVGICLHNPLLSKNGKDADQQCILRHFRHITRIVGKNKVGWGSDFGGNTAPPSRFKNCTDLVKSNTLVRW